MDAIEDFITHVTETGIDQVPEAALCAAKTFTLDSVGVGLSGGNGPWMSEMVQLSKKWGQGDDARVWGNGQRLPAPAAAMCNAYQIHNAEFDCVHEGAVVHSMTVLLGATLAVAERDRGISGKDLILASILGVDVACHIAVAVTTGLKFFRPGTAGALAAVTAVGKIKNFNRVTLRNAYSIAYGQMCGTMQAHTEGSSLLGMQVGFNARNAVVACDMANAGLTGPKNILEGPFGFLRLFEDAYDRANLIANLGDIWRITELSHKPFPSGRATHGIVDGCLRLQRQSGFSPDQIKNVQADVPPLIFQLVGRPVTPNMTTNYAQLCAQYVTAHALYNDGIGVNAYEKQTLEHTETNELARRINVIVNDNPDPNALSPVEITVTLKTGETHKITVQDVYGSPANPMSHDAHIEKFLRNCETAPAPLSARQIDHLIEMIENLEKLDDVTALIDAMMP